MGKSLKTAEAWIFLTHCCVKERGFETITGPLDNWMSLPSVWPELSMGFCNADIMLLSTGSRKFDGRMSFIGRAISANQTTSERRKSWSGFRQVTPLSLAQLVQIQAKTPPPTFCLVWCCPLSKILCRSLDDDSLKCPTGDLIPGNSRLCFWWCVSVPRNWSSYSKSKLARVATSPYFIF